MAVNFFYEHGEKFVVTATAPIDYHAIVVAGTMVGVSTKAAEIGETISCDAVGVYALKKKSGVAITQGAICYVDASGEVSVTASGNTRCGIAWAKAETTDETVLVKLNA